MPKLEAVKKEQDRMELLNKKLIEVNNTLKFKLQRNKINALLLVFVC
jgi:hypothetical protein